jgi:multidrug transporter EmrE-like cation transporter
MGSGEPKTHRGLLYHLELVVAETMRWPVATIVVITLVTGGGVALYINQGQFDSTFLLVSALNNVCGLLGLKSLMHLMTYARWHKKPFPGSFLVATAIAMIPIFAFYGTGFYLLAVQDRKLPPAMAFLVLFGLGYPLFTVFVAGFFRLQQAMQLQWLKGIPWWRLGPDQ